MRVSQDCGKNFPVLHAPGKAFYPERSVAWLAGGMCALFLVATPSCRAATGGVAGQPEIAAQSQSGFTLGQLMTMLARRQRGTVSYVETDYLAILDRPVRSSGVLVYEAPDHLEKRELTPKKESLVLDGDELTVRRGGRTYRMELSSYPQVAPLVDAIRDTLAGDEAGLERAFKVGFSGTKEDWKLRLVPLERDVARKVRNVRITGTGDEIQSVEILQVGGDRSVMRVGVPGKPR